MVCLPFHHFRFKINNLEANKKSASLETISHVIRYLASLEDFCMRFCMHLLYPNHVPAPAGGTKFKGIRSGLDGLVSRTGRRYNPRQTLMLSGLDGAVIRIGRIEYQAIS